MLVHSSTPRGLGRGLTRRRRVVALGALALVLTCSVVGTLDHNGKEAAIAVAEVRAWHCWHGPQPPPPACARVDPDGMERRWTRRKIGYGIGAGGGLVLLIGAVMGPGGRRVRRLGQTRL